MGCIYERTLQRNRLSGMPNITKTYLEDGDEVIMEGWCISRKSGKTFGFGQSRGVVVPALV